MERITHEGYIKIYTGFFQSRGCTLYRKGLVLNII